MIGLQKIRALIADNLRNLAGQKIIEIFLVLQSSHIVYRDQDKVVFYINNYIDKNQFNLLYDLNQIKKSIKNTNAIVCKLELASSKATNNRLKIVREEKSKKEEVKERRKAEVMIAKQSRARRRISLFNKKEDKSDIRNNRDLNQAKHKYL